MENIFNLKHVLDMFSTRKTKERHRCFLEKKVNKRTINLGQTLEINAAECTYYRMNKPKLLKN